MTETMVFSLTIVGVLVVVLGILRLRHVSLQGLVLGLMGAIVGLLLGALASVPVSKLPQPWGGTLPVLVTVVFTLAMIVIVLSRRSALLHLLPVLKLSPNQDSSNGLQVSSDTAGSQILVDTSAIIDGRIADIAAAGFVPGKLIVPRFVLAELQNIADSDDAMRRGRGRRGLEVLNRLREMPGITVEVTDEDVSSIKEVDAKLVALAQRFSCDVLTTDYNLNRVAQIQGVRVLNVNELSNAIRPVVLPGEELIVRVVQPGKERNQGVGYLADGTMIVVENGDKLMGQEVATEVTRVFQTVAGKMIFAVPRKDNTAAAPIASAPAAAQAEPIKPVVANEPAVAKPSVDAASPAPAKGSGHNGRSRNRGRGRGGNGNSNGNNFRPGSVGDIESRIVEHNNQPDNTKHE